MAYKDESTKWGFTVPQPGELDSSEGVRDRLREVDNAILDPMQKQVLSGGGAYIRPGVVAGEADYSESPDQYWSDIEGREVFTTKMHFHPSQESVQYADRAGHADECESASRSETAEKLNPGANINGKRFDGSQGITLTADDIPGIPRIAFGYTMPNGLMGLSAPLRAGDLYFRLVD